MTGMDGRDALPARRSIRTRLLLLLLGLTTVSVAIIAYLSVNSILGMGQSAQEASNATLRARDRMFVGKEEFSCLYPNQSADGQYRV